MRANDVLDEIERVADVLKDKPRKDGPPRRGAR